MTIESATYVSQLNPSYPAAGDAKSEGDDHLRLIKTVLQAQFPSLGTAAVNRTAAELDTVTAKAIRAGDTYTGTHDYTGATINVPTQTAGDSSTKAASTAFVGVAVAAVSASGGAPSVAIDANASITAVRGQHIVCTYAGTVTVTLPASPSSGDIVWVTPGNGRSDTVIARNGNLIMGAAEDMTHNMAYRTAMLRYVSAPLGWRITQ